MRLSHDLNVGYWIYGKENRRCWEKHEEEQWQAVKNRAWALSKGLCFEYFDRWKQ